MSPRNLLFIAFAVSVSARAQFGPPYTAFTADHQYPVFLSLHDLDADGDLDPLIGTTTGISWFANDGTGQFGTRIPIGTGFTGHLSANDMDGDGDLDVVASGDVWPGYSDLGWYANDGAGNFTPMNQILGTITSSYGLTIEDLDGDSDVDMIYRGGGYMKLHFNDGTGSFGPVVNLGTFATGGNASIVVRDADGDSDADVMVLGDAPQHGYYQNLGGGTFAASTLIPGALNDGLAMVWDRDADGDIDLLLNDPVRWMLNDGTGTFTTADTISNGSIGGHTSDIDNDGDADFFGGSTLNLNVFQSRNDDTAFFSIQVEYVQGYSLQGVHCATGDLDGDADKDLLVCNGMGMFGWYAGDGNNNWSIRRNIGSVLTWPPDAVTADFDLDGDLDMATIGYNDDRFAWYANDGTGTLGAQQPIADNMNGPQDLEVFDMDQDQDSDMVLFNTLANTVVRARNNGAGIFVVDTIAVQTGPLASTYLDGDLHRDLVAGDAWYLNDGNGNFTLQVDFGLSTVYAVACGDMDGDQQADIVYASDQLYVMKEIAGTSFTSVASTGTSSRIALADIDADGDLDVATVGGTTYYWYENDGTGALTPQAYATNVPTSPVAVLASDVNNDGAAEIIWVRSSGYTHEMYYVLNDGTGGFGPFYMMGTGGYQAIGLADMNGDVVADLWRADPGSIKWMENYFYDAFRLRGDVFKDFDQDGVHDPADEPLPFLPMRTDPAGFLAWTGSNGTFDLPVDSGITYQLWPHLPSFFHVTSIPDTAVVQCTAAEPIIDSLLFGIGPVVDTTLDMVSLTSSVIACNNYGTAWVTVRNTGSYISTGITIHLMVHPDMTILGYTPPPDSVVGNQVYWHLDSLPWFAVHQFLVELQAGPLGSSTDASVIVIYQDEPHGVQVDLDGIVGCAFDPNDKQVEPIGYGAFGAVPIDQEWLAYTIRFQNTGTAPAQNVVLVDQLSDQLDWPSMEIMGASHPLTQITIDPLGELIFRFDGIQLPDSGADMAGSNGFVKFRLRPVAGLPSGTTISNGVAIFFDLNAPVITNTVLNTLIDCNLYTSTITYMGIDLLQASEGESYQWYLDGLPIAGATSQELLVPSDGSYTVEVTSVHGCTALSDDYQVIGMEVEAQGAMQMAVMPNPAHDQVRLIASEPITAEHVITLTDVHGRVLRTLSGKGSREVIIDLGDLPQGLYMVLVRGSDGVMGTSRVVVE